MDDSNKTALHALKNYMVCKDAIALLLDYGRIKWRTCQQAVKRNHLPDHGNKGKLTGKAKRFAVEVKADLHDFFKEIKQFAAPKSTRFVREETGIGLCDGKENLNDHMFLKIRQKVSESAGGGEASPLVE